VDADIIECMLLYDSVGFQGAYWVLIVMPLMPLCLYFVYTWYKRATSVNASSDEDVKGASGGNEEDLGSELEMTPYSIRTTKWYW